MPCPISWRGTHEQRVVRREFEPRIERDLTALHRRFEALRVGDAFGCEREADSKSAPPTSPHQSGTRDERFDVLRTGVAVLPAAAGHDHALL